MPIVRMLRYVRLGVYTEQQLQDSVGFLRAVESVLGSAKLPTLKHGQI